MSSRGHQWGSGVVKEATAGNGDVRSTTMLHSGNKPCLQSHKMLKTGAMRTNDFTSWQSPPVETQCLQTAAVCCGWTYLMPLCWPVIYLNSWHFSSLCLSYVHWRFRRKGFCDFKCISLCPVSYFNLQAIGTVSIDPQGWYLLTFWCIVLCILHVVPTYLFISYYLMVEERETLLIKLILTSIPWSKKHSGISLKSCGQQITCHTNRKNCCRQLHNSMRIFWRWTRWSLST